MTDAVAQMGLSPALRNRLVAAESELATLASGKAARRTPTMVTDDEQIGAQIRSVALRLEKALASDVEVARGILAGRLGEIRVEEKDDGIYAQMDIGPVLLEAVGADVAKYGCGDAQLVLATPKKQQLMVPVVVHLGDRVARRTRSQS